MEKQEPFLNHKRISNKLPLLGVAFVIIVILGFLIKEEPKHKYEVSVEDTLEKVLERKQLMSPEKFSEIYNSKDSSYQFIDLRSAHDYLQNHLPGAINIPINKLLDEEFKEILNQEKKVNVLYHNKLCDACGPWILLTELGYENNLLLQGGYKYIKTNIIDKDEPKLDNFRSEKAKYDFAKIVKETSGASVAKSEDSTVPAPPPPSNKKKVVEEEGGC